ARAGGGGARILARLWPGGPAPPGVGAQPRDSGLDDAALSRWRRRWLHLSERKTLDEPALVAPLYVLWIPALLRSHLRRCDLRLARSSASLPLVACPGRARHRRRHRAGDRHRRSVGDQGQKRSRAVPAHRHRRFVSVVVAAYLGDWIPGSVFPNHGRHGDPSAHPPRGGDGPVSHHALREIRAWFFPICRTGPIRDRAIEIGPAVAVKSGLGGESRWTSEWTNEDCAARVAPPRPQPRSCFSRFSRASQERSRRRSPSPRSLGLATCPT